MTARDLTLNIAVNLGRIARWTTENKTSRIPLFLEETEKYFKELEDAPKADKFIPTFESFKKEFNRLKNSTHDINWADDLYTWANILSNRARLA